MVEREPLLETRHLMKRFGGVVATNDLSLSVVSGELHAIIGPNGAGKTTLVAQISGEMQPTSGSVVFEGQDITTLPSYDRCLRGIGRSYQITSLFPDFTCVESTGLAIQAHRGHSFRFWSNVRRNATWRDEACEILTAVGLGKRLGVLAGELSYGEQRQLELAMVLAGQPKIVVLDEPMAGIAGEESTRIVHLLEGLKGRYTIVLIEHDMDVVFRLADRISVLVYGRCIATGTPEQIRSNAEVREAYLGDEELAT